MGLARTLISVIFFWNNPLIDAFGGFDQSQVYNAYAALEDSLDVAHITSLKVQHAYQLGFYGNESKIHFKPLGFDLASSIMSLKQIYYQIWVAFNDGAYLGYYQKEPFSSKYNEYRHGVSFSFNENHSCPQYTYNIDDYELSGLGTDPGNSTNNITSHCQEHFLMSNQNGQFDGPGSQSVGGQIYDARTHDWYNSVVENNKKEWVDYVDTLVNEPALAVCYPLNNRTDDGEIGESVLGVTCTGLFVSELCEKLYLSLDGAKSFAYIRDRIDSTLVAASVNDTSLVFNYDDSVLDRYNITSSPVPLINWSSKLLGKPPYGENGAPPYGESLNLILHDVDNEVDNNGNSYFVAVEPFQEGITLNWDLVILQIVECPIGYEVAGDNQTCLACISPLTSSGGNARCNECIPNYYKLSSWGQCLPCPSGATCNGGYELPVSQAGNWGDDSYKDGRYLTTMYQCQTISGQSCLANYTCLNGFGGRQCSEPEKGYMFLGAYSMKCGYVGSVDMGSGGQAFIVYFFLLIFMFCANYSVYYYDSFDILVNSLQNVALIYEIQFNWPQNSSILVGTVAQWALLGLDAVFPTCLGAWTFFDNIIVQLVLPIVIIPLLITGLVLFKIVKKEHLHKMIGFGFLFLDLSYTGLVLNSFQVFACQSATNGNSYIYAAPTLQCYTPQHNNMRIICFFILLIIGIGYPLGIYLLTTRYIAKKSKLKKKHFRIYGFAFDTFKYNYNHWSFVQLTRNFITCAIAALLVTDPGQQGALYFMITIVNIVVIMTYEPLISKDNAFLEICLSLIEIGVLIIGFLYGIEYAPNQLLLEIVLVLLLVVYPVMMVIVVFNEIIDHNVAEGTRSRLISFNKKLVRTLTNNKIPRKSKLGQQQVSFDEGNQPYHIQKAMAKDCLTGMVTGRYKRGKKGHEDDDAIYTFVKVFSPRELNVWAHDKNRNGFHIDQCRSIGQALTPLLEKTHFVSYYSSDTFWAETISSSPVFIDFILESLRTFTPEMGGGTKKFKQKQKSLLLFFKFLRDIKKHKKVSGSFSSLIDENALAPLLYFCMTEANQEQIDMLFVLLTEMNPDSTDKDIDILKELHLRKGLNGHELNSENSGSSFDSENSDSVSPKLTLKSSAHKLILNARTSSGSPTLNMSSFDTIEDTIDKDEDEDKEDEDEDYTQIIEESNENENVELDRPSQMEDLNPLKQQIELVARINAKNRQTLEKNSSASFIEDLTSDPVASLNIFE